MPEYIYLCICKNKLTVVEPMVVEKRPNCPKCGGIMWRKPQPVSVHWDSGLPPSAGEFSPEIQNHLDNVDEIREKTDEKYYLRDYDKTE